MYRAVTLAAKERGLDLADADRLAQLAGEIHVDLDGEHVFVDGRDVTKEIRTFDITTSIQYAADNPAVRNQLVTWQRAAADGRDVVTEGRDQGTVVFPDAECKIFLTADEPERAQRRFRDLVARGEHVTFDEVLRGAAHPRRTRLQPLGGALLKADDAVEVSTNGLTPEEVVVPAGRNRAVETMTGRSWISRCWYTINWSLCFAFARLVHLHSVGKANVPPTGPVMLVGNHQSHLDPVLIGVACSRQLRILARDTLFRGPFG